MRRAGRCAVPLDANGTLGMLQWQVCAAQKSNETTVFPELPMSCLGRARSRPSTLWNVNATLPHASRMPGAHYVLVVKDDQAALL